jgi:uncharacterized protein YjbJ (UPF0337 family)
MNRHHIEHNWKQFKGRIKDHQGSTTGDQFEMICGHCAPVWRDGAGPEFT